MKIALIGYGNMGKEIEKVIQETKSHRIVSISYSDTSKGLDKKGLQKADIAIDFTSSEIVLQNISEVASLGVSMVVGTTGWYEHIEKVKHIVNKTGIGFIYGQNFSIGANIFFRIVDYASKLVHNYGVYDVAGYEMHHAGKKDSPSGTAKKLADILMRNIPEKTTLQSDRSTGPIQAHELHFTSVRVGNNPGRHEIIFDSPADEITLSHAARGRRGFAEGAVSAAEFISDKKGMHTFDELFEGGNL